MRLFALFSRLIETFSEKVSDFSKFQIFLASFSILFVFTFHFKACTVNDYDPQTLPFILTSIAEYRDQLFAKDLDGDGIDEVIHLRHTDDPFVKGNRIESLRIATLGNKTIEQVIYTGSILRPHFLDWDADGYLEIVVPYLVNDSLFVSFVSWQGERLFSFFLTGGSPRIEETGVFDWDPDIRHVYLMDLNNDGLQELITVLFTAFARLPRGILIHSLPEGKLLGQNIIGAVFDGQYFDDFDGNGLMEITGGSSATNNGAYAGGFDDQHAYIINFELTLPPTIKFSKKIGATWGRLDMFYEDFDGDGNKEFLAFTQGSSTIPNIILVEFIDPKTWKTIQMRTINESIKWPHIVDLNRDLKPEILAIRSPDELWVLNDNFDIVKRQKFANKLTDLNILPDMDGDGIDEIIAYTPENELLINHRLEVIASLPRIGTPQTLNRGVGMNPDLLVRENERSTVYRLQNNSRYLVNRYGPSALWAVGINLILGLLLFQHRQHRRSNFFQGVQRLTLETDTRGFMVLDHHGCIILHNNCLLQLMGQETKDAKLHGKKFQDILRHKQVISFLQNAMQQPYTRRDIELDLKSNQPDFRILILVDPLFHLSKKNPNWLVLVIDRTQELELKKIKTWGIMARNIAHEIKNPLTSIQLTIQRMQMEYNDHAPKDLAQALDDYAARIIDRIESLRQMTRNFMKFIDTEKLNLTESKLDGFLHKIAASISQNLPPDITLDLKLNAGKTVVRIDQEQMQVLIENLVSNALNAMPDGGKITIRSAFEKELRLPQNSFKPVDFAIFSVADTGCGIPKSAREHIFEPDFSDSEHGTGLGLAIVKKIVESHQGFIEVESEEGSGSVFSICLPVKQSRD